MDGSGDTVRGGIISVAIYDQAVRDGKVNVLTPVPAALLSRIRAGASTVEPFASQPNPYRYCAGRTSSRRRSAVLPCVSQ
jgi:hypothetical protein